MNFTVDQEEYIQSSIYVDSVYNNFMFRSRIVSLLFVWKNQEMIGGY